MTAASLRLLALKDLVQRYAQVFKATWSVRDQLTPPERLDHEIAFLPASLELVERPVHPAPRWAMASICLLVLLGIAWAVIGQVDIVVTAHGKLVPGVRVKVVQPAVTGVVRRILVRDGQRVQQGELLMELDPTQAVADESKVHSARIQAQLARARAQALLDALQSGRAPTLGPVDEASPDERAEAARLIDGMYRELRDKVAAAEATLRQRQAELESTRHQIDKLRSTAPLARQQAEDYRSLLDRKYVTHTDFLDKESNALQQEHELAAQNSRAHELQEAIAAQRSGIAGLTSQFRREQLDALEKARLDISQDINDETKARTRRDLMRLISPSPGTVQQLAVHTLGGVVSAAQAVMEIVPDDQLEIEAVIENKDVGFVKVGQPVAVKVDAFPYTRYGILDGTVTLVATDAVSDRKSGPGFVAHVRIPSNRMNVNGAPVPLTPGMTVTAEIKTGKRSLAAYLLDPLVQTTQESMRER